MEQSVTIQLSLSEWQDCLTAMKTLLRSNKENLKMEEISTNVNKINKTIFAKHETNDNTIPNLKDITDEQFDQLLDEITQENVGNEVCSIYLCLLTFFWIVLTKQCKRVRLVSMCCFYFCFGFCNVMMNREVTDQHMRSILWQCLENKFHTWMVIIHTGVLI